MLVLKIDEAPDRTLVTTMLEGKEREWDYGELEVWREAR